MKFWNCKKPNKGNRMPRRFYEKDGSLAPLQGKTIAIIGYGSQGHAHALNLRDSGLKVVVGLQAQQQERGQSSAAGLQVLSIADAAKAARRDDVLVPDHVQGEILPERYRATHDQGQDADVRAWIRYSFQRDQAACRCGCFDDCAEGAGTSRARIIRGGHGRSRAGGCCSGCFRQGVGKCSGLCAWLWVV